MGAVSGRKLRDNLWIESGNIESGNLEGGPKKT